MAQNPSQFHPVLIGHFVLLHAGLDVSRGQQGGFRQHLAIVFHRVKRAGAGKGLNAAPLLGEIVGQRFSATFQMTNGVHELDGVCAVAEDDGIHHAAQVGVGQVFVLLLDDHGSRKLLGGDQQVDDRLFGVVVFPNDRQDVFGRQLRQHHHQRLVAFGVGQFHQCRLGAHNVAGGNEALGFGNQSEVVHASVLWLKK